MKRKKPSLTVDFDDIIAPDLRDDEFVAIYLNDALNDPDPRLFLIALGRVAKARGIGMTQLAAKLKLTRRGLYYALSKTGNPQWNTLSRLLDTLGLRISVSTKKAG
jgi:probable addiction module antidote protein